jgi:hypothetical protein
MAKIETFIRKEANKSFPYGKFNLPQYKNENGKLHGEYVRAETHHNVCKAIVAFMQNHPSAPFTFVIAVACQKDAHKEKAFLKGYKSFDGAKVEVIMQMLSLYYQHNKNTKKPSDVAWRLIMRYYENVSTNVEDFKATLATSKVYGKRCGSRDINYSELCANLGMTFYDYVKDDGISLEEMLSQKAKKTA